MCLLIQRDQIPKHSEIKPVIPIHIRNERNKVLRNLSYQKLQYFTALHSGETRKVLFENFEKNGMMEGYTDNYIRVSASFKKEWANQILDWKL
jgi:threonylcarbamoyladenosine tRNA methylthiotransferase MtaB